MSRIESLRKTAAEVAERVADDVTREIEQALRNELTERLTLPEQTREGIFETAKRIAREHRCHTPEFADDACDCGEEIAMDLETERLR